MTISVTSTGTIADIKKDVADLAKLFGVGVAATSTSASALNAAEESRVRGDAVVVKPKDKAKDKPKDKAPEPEPEDNETPAEEADDALDGDVKEEEPEFDPEQLRKDVHVLLRDVKDAYPDNPKVIAEIVGKFGVDKFSKIKDEQLVALEAMAKNYISKAKKKK